MLLEINAPKDHNSLDQYNYESFISHKGSTNRTKINNIAINDGKQNVAMFCKIAL